MKLMENGSVKLTIALVLSLLCFIFYHIFYLNTQKYYLIKQEGLAQIKKGSLSFGGHKEVKWTNDAFKKIFAAIKISDSEDFKTSYDDIFAVFDHWFPILEKSIKKEIKNENWDSKTLEDLIKRVEVWPGLDQEKSKKLKIWQAELAYFRANKILKSIDSQMEEARSLLKKSIQFNSSKSKFAKELLNKIESQLKKPEPDKQKKQSVSKTLTAPPLNTEKGSTVLEQKESSSF